MAWAARSCRPRKSPSPCKMPPMMRVARVLACLFALSGGAPAVRAQDLPPKPPAETAPPEEKKLDNGQLEQLVAPIALYPDDLIAQVLMASTYPLEIVEAARWAKKPENAKLKGEALDKALAAQSWDTSVKSLVPFPTVLTNMDEKLDWTQQLGDAFLEQQKDVMDSIQRLRKKAQDAGNLKSNEQQTVKVETAPDPVTKTETQVIIIEPANPQVVYVPTYQPTVVYGTWGYPAYPPYYWPAPPGAYFASGFFWGAAIGVSAAYWGGASCGWHSGDIDINNNTDINIDRGDRNTNIDRGDRGDRGQGNRGEGNRGQGDRGQGGGKVAARREPPQGRELQRREDGGPVQQGRRERSRFARQLPRPHPGGRRARRSRRLQPGRRRSRQSRSRREPEGRRWQSRSRLEPEGRRRQPRSRLELEGRCVRSLGRRQLGARELGARQLEHGLTRRRLQRRESRRRESRRRGTRRRRARRREALGAAARFDNDSLRVRALARAARRSEAGGDTGARASPLPKPRPTRWRRPRPPVTRKRFPRSSGRRHTTSSNPATRSRTRTRPSRSRRISRRRIASRSRATPRRRSSTAATTSRSRCRS